MNIECEAANPVEKCIRECSKSCKTRPSHLSTLVELGEEKSFLDHWLKKRREGPTFSGIGKNRIYRYRRSCLRKKRQIKYNSQGLEKTTISRILRLTIIKINI